MNRWSCPSASPRDAGTGGGCQDINLPLARAPAANSGGCSPRCTPGRLVRGHAGTNPPGALRFHLQGFYSLRCATCPRSQGWDMTPALEMSEREGGEAARALPGRCWTPPAPALGAESGTGRFEPSGPKKHPFQKWNFTEIHILPTGGSSPRRQQSPAVPVAGRDGRRLGAAPAPLPRLAVVVYSGCSSIWRWVRLGSAQATGRAVPLATRCSWHQSGVPAASRLHSCDRRQEGVWLGIQHL